MSNPSRSQKAALNTISYIFYELVNIISSFILPGLILRKFGSSYNGITASINQFLTCMSLFYAGVTGVTRAALYKPIGINDKAAVSSIVKATEAFMHKISYIFLAALLLFSTVYPLLVKQDFDWWFACSLVVIIGISTFFQYFFAASYKILLAADQNNYIITAINILAVAASTVISVILIKTGFSIHIVKFGSTAVFILNPIAINIYARKKYRLHDNVSPDNTALSQRWDAFAHSVANIVNTNTDIILLTVFTNIREVSVYSVYYLIINGINKVGSALSSGIEAAFGNMLTNDDRTALNRNMSAFESLLFLVSNILYTCSAITIVPFVLIYTTGVTDINYDRIAFGYLVSAAGFFTTIRIPYQTMVQAAGQYKQTKKGAVIEAVVNFVVSLALVIKFGLIGVTTGTLTAMIFRTCQYAIYVYKNITHMNIIGFIKRIVMSFISISVIVAASFAFPASGIKDYGEWIPHAIMLFIFCAAISGVMLFLFCRNDVICLLYIAKNIVNKHSKKNALSLTMNRTK